MKQLDSLLRTVSIASISSLAWACSHGPTVQEFPNTASAQEEVSKFDADLNVALSSQVDVLSPRNFKEAKESLNDAKSSLAKQKDAKDTLHKVAEGRAYLDRANEFSRLSHANIEEVIVARQQAISAGAPGLLASDFRKADETLIAATSRIEENELKTASENRSALQLKYLDLELRSIKQSRLGGARATITQAVKEGAKDLSPRTLAIAEKSIQDTDAFITGNRHDTARITERADESRKSAEHVLKIARDSKAGKQSSAEDQALRMEGEQNKVADKETQILDKDSQLVNKQAQLNDNQARLDSSQAQLADNKVVLSSNQVLLAEGASANQALAARNANLASDKAFNARFEEARAEFTRSEAEVYKQGNTLTIRLRGLEFPVAQAILRDGNFPLLAKVQKVINGFGKSSVIVEGHTDSVGGKVRNEKLSTDRAQAVRDYFLANTGGHPLNVQAIGYGFQKPLASNKTANGRAQNRRVDVLIQAESPPATTSN